MYYRAIASEKSAAALLLVALLLSGSAPVAHADQTLTLELPPSKAVIARQQEAAELARQKAASARANLAPGRGTPISRSQGGTLPGRDLTQPSRHQNGSERVVGRLGQVQVAAPIRPTRSLAAPKLTVTEAGTYLAIKDEQGDWYGVLMSDGSLGWIARSAVRILNYQVTSTGEPVQQPPWDNQAGGNSSLPPNLGIPDVYARSDRPYFAANPQAFLNEAYKYLGVPYVWGGNTHNGIDCSGFVKNVYEALGFPLPRLGSDQMAYGVPVPPEQLQPGDRLYFVPRTDGKTVEHTGLYVGNGYFIHASSGRHQVTVSSLNEPFYRKNFVCARR